MAQAAYRGAIFFLGSAPMPVELKVQLVSVAEDGSERAEDLLVLTKQHER